MESGCHDQKPFELMCIVFLDPVVPDTGLGSLDAGMDFLSRWDCSWLLHPFVSTLAHSF